MRPSDLSEGDRASFPDPLSREVESRPVKVERLLRSERRGARHEIDGVGRDDHVGRDPELLMEAPGQLLGRLELPTVVVQGPRWVRVVVLRGEEQVRAPGGPEPSGRFDALAMRREMAMVVDDRETRRERHGARGA